MKKLQYLFAFISIIFIVSCGQNKNPQQISKEGDVQNAETPQEPATKSYSASFTINNKTYQCTDVSAVAVEKTNSLVIQARSNADNENEAFYFSFAINGIDMGTKKFDTAGNYGEFTEMEKFTYESNYIDDCTNLKSTTNGTITMKSIKDGTAEVEGSFEADFEGQMMKKYEVPSYPCANGTSTNKKIEFINVKGSLKGSYINTKNVPL
jgi:hypothetical protein